jgi:very-short-patch-repair endonuclease
MTPDERCLQAAAGRFGIITRAEALAAGLNIRQVRHRVKKGMLEEMLPGVYRYAGSPSIWEQRVCAAQAWAGDGSAASGRCAAALWGLNGILPTTVEITSGRVLRSPDPSVIVRRAQLTRSEIRSRQGIAVTSPERTLLDLGRTVPERILESALDDAMCKRLTTSDRLWQVLQERGRRGRNGTAALRGLMLQLGESPGTDRFERLLFAALASGSLPRPTPQFPVKVGGQTFYLDFAYPKARLGIEAHSFTHHSKREDWERDQVRHAALVTQGWTMLYVTWRRLRDHPDLVVSDIRQALDRFECVNDNKLAF